MTKSKTFIAAFAVAGVVFAAGCGQKYAAERDGKKLGEAICDLRDADDQDDVQDATDEIREQLDDLGNKYAFYTAEDRADVENNLADLAEHAIQDQPGLAQQDLTVLERSANNIKDDLNETSRAAWEGLLQGLADCTQG
jgi:hypothetical protein